MKKILIINILFLCNCIFGQGLLDERIRQISNKKRSVYLDRGIFHNGGPKHSATLKAVRHSYTKKLGYERVVFDFNTKETPRIYGNINGLQKKLYLDFFKTTVGNNIASFGKSIYVDSLNFFPIDKDSLSVELVFKKKVSVDIFSLENPGRLVIDVKN